MGLRQHLTGKTIASGWLLLLLLLAVVWLWDIAGPGAPMALKQLVVILVVGSTGLLCLTVGVRMWRQSEDSSQALLRRWLLGLVVLAVVVRFVGLDFEISGRYYRDEGIYYAAAEEINKGDLLPESFIYGHLPYYMYALVLWIQGLFPEPIARLVGWIYNVQDQVDVSWALMRGVNAGLSALTTVPVFLTAAIVSGPFAAVVAALLIIFSPIYNEITRLIISDSPSAFFAAMSVFFVARLLDRERRRDYLLAGATAGLAAACKYPAGVVAVASVAVWIYWRIKLRNWRWHLIWAGLVSIGALLLVMPAFWAHPGAAFAGEGKDLLFGLRQYGRGGWIGVMPTSNSVWYGNQLAASFGWPALALGATGWVFLKSAHRRRFLLLAPYPVIFLWLVSSMSMVVKRNLLPVLPALAVMLGCGVTGWYVLFCRRSPRRAAVAAAVISLLALAIPIRLTVEQTLGLANPSTRELARYWINSNLPRGTTIIKESYTPHLHFKKFQIRQTRFAARLPLDEIRNQTWDYLLLAQNAYGRFLSPENWTKPHHEAYAERYEEMLDFEVMREFLPSRTRMGPSLRLFKIDPEPVTYARQHRFDLGEEGFIYPRDGDYLLLKEYFDSGTFELTFEVEPNSAPGSLRVVTRDNESVAQEAIVVQSATIVLPRQAKYFLYIYFPKDATLLSVEATAAPVE